MEQLQKEVDQPQGKHGRHQKGQHAEHVGQQPRGTQLALHQAQQVLGICQQFGVAVLQHRQQLLLQPAPLHQGGNLRQPAGQGRHQHHHQGGLPVPRQRLPGLQPQDKVIFFHHG